jgi:hypothetical protein
MIHSDCTDRILQTQLTSPNIVGLFNKLSDEAEANGLPAATIVTVFYDQHCALTVGDWAAELHLVVRKVTDDDREYFDDDGNKIEFECKHNGEDLDSDDGNDAYYDPANTGGYDPDTVGRDFGGPGVNPETDSDDSEESDKS